jgi:hypothetical protein
LSPARVKEKRHAISKWPLQDLQRRFNASYYSGLDSHKATSNERLGFYTPSQGKRYAQICALEFIESARERKGALRVDEFGAADGTFAKHFLDFIRERASDVYERLTYLAWDKFESLKPVLEQALSSHQNTFIGAADVVALKTQFQPESSDLIFCNELFDDLATRVVARRDGILKELWFSEVNILGATAYQYEWHPIPHDIRFKEEIQRVMMTLPERFRMTFPEDGINALYGLSAILKPGGRLRLFDYGYPNPQAALQFTMLHESGAAGRPDLFSAGYSFVGLSVDKEGTRQTSHGSAENFQITTPVNFPFLSFLSEKLGLGARIENWLKWASRIVGEPQTSPSHYSQGVAYSCNLQSKTADGTPLDIVILLQAYKALRGSIPPQQLARKLQEPNGIYERILRKAKPMKLDLNIVPESSQQDFRQSLAPEIDELVGMGFDRKELDWALFATPTDHSLTGSSAFVCFSAHKLPE